MNRFWKISYLLLSVLVMNGCMNDTVESEEVLESQSDYGVFLSLQGSKAVTASKDYETVVVDAQYLTAEEIGQMQERGQKVYTYLNIGSIETFRPYYEEYQSLVVKPYLNWDNEYWVDMTSEEWQELVASTLPNQLLEKGVDGFWVDNVDVYGQSPTTETYMAVETVLKKLMSYGKPVIINGGNEFTQAYLKINQQVDEILTGVNQETVFSRINFDNQILGTQTNENSSYYIKYLNMLDELGNDIYLLEYTIDSDLIETIHSYAKERDWNYYISDSIELDGK